MGMLFDTDRKISLVGAFDYEMYLSFSERLDCLLAESTTKPVCIELYSHGGEEDAAVAIYSKMLLAPVEFHVYAYSLVQSAATLIMAAGDRRFAHETTTFMVHEGNVELAGEVHLLKTKLVDLETQEKKWWTLMEKHTTTPYDKWRLLAKKTTYFSATQAKELGMLDIILTKGPKCKKPSRKK